MENTNTLTIDNNHRTDFIAKTFSLDSTDQTFEGYGFIGDYWNGWACPYLPYESMVKFVETVNDGEYITAFYSPFNDQFVFFDHCSANENGNNYVSQIGSTTINGIKVYTAHHLCWCFTEASEPVETESNLKSFDVRTVYTEWLTLSVQAASHKQAEKLVENGQALPNEYWERLTALQKEFGIDFCDSEIEVMGSDENE